MAHNKHQQEKSFWPVAISLGFLLFIAIFVSLVQLQKRNSLQSRADSVSVNFQNCEVDPGSLEISNDEQNLLDSINEYRQQYGISPLVWSDSLVRGASWLSDDMAKNKYLSHTDSLGRGMQKRLLDCGYSGFITMGENIDSGGSDSNSTLNAWKHSPPHNANLLNGDFKEAGIAASNTQNGHFWTLDLGAKEDDNSPTPSSDPTISPLPSISVSPITSLTPSISPTAQSTTPTTKPSPTTFKQPSNTPVPTNTPIPTPTISGPTPTVPAEYIPNPQDTQLFVSVKVVGIGKDGNRTPKNLTRHATVELFDLNNKLQTTGNGFLVYDGESLFRGIIHFGPIPNNTYFVKIRVDNMLRVQVSPIFQEINNTRLNLMPEVIELQGDVNGDNVINIKDYNFSLSCFQAAKCKDIELIDFSDDGVSNIVDYNILLRNYWESQGD